MLFMLIVIILCYFVIVFNFFNNLNRQSFSQSLFGHWLLSISISQFVRLKKNIRPFPTGKLFHGGVCRMETGNAPPPSRGNRNTHVC